MTLVRWLLSLPASARSARWSSEQRHGDQLGGHAADAIGQPGRADPDGSARLAERDDDQGGVPFHDVRGPQAEQATRMHDQR